jgi:type IV pilus assembly protein PilA
MRRSGCGFTLIELVIVIAIIGIVASLAISTYQTYTVRTQVSEGIAFVSGIESLVIDAYSKNAAPPIGRVEAGATPNAEDSRSSYVTGVAVVNGRIDVTFGNEAHQEITAETLSLTPYLTTGDTVVWRCGNAPAPSEATELAGGGITAEHKAATVDSRYLPGNCR